MIRKLLLVAVVVSLVVTAVGAGTAFARDSRETAYLYEKDPSTWDVVGNGAWGKLDYWADWDEYEFKFKGRGLERWTEYTLIYYPDPWPGSGLVCLGDDESNRRGKVRIRDSVEAGDLPLPAAFDDNYPTGAKIWLVLSDDVDCGNQEMTGWNPTEYLFENELISLPKRFLYLYEKDSAWDVVDDGAWGRLDFRPDGSEFMLHIDGNRLDRGTDYTLIYYPDPWPGSGLVCLGDDTADRRGRIHIREWLSVSGIPDAAKIWLVLSADVHCGNQEMIGWNPTEYLFENNLITFN
jgi:hypothetical protein